MCGGWLPRSCQDLCEDGTEFVEGLKFSEKEGDVTWDAE